MGARVTEGSGRERDRAMIPELFLTAALSLPVPSFMSMLDTPNGRVVVVRWFLQKIHLEKNNEKVLLVDGEDFTVQRLRANGVQAFGVWDPNNVGLMTKYHAIAEPGKLPFRNGTFHMVYWMRGGAFTAVKAGTWLSDVAGTVERGGLLFFLDLITPHWSRFLDQAHWQRLPFLMDGLSVWRKPMERFKPSSDRHWDRMPQSLRSLRLGRSA